MTRKRSLPAAGPPGGNADRVLSMSSIGRATVSILLATVLASNSILDANAFAQTTTFGNQGVAFESNCKAHKTSALHRRMAATSSSVLDAPLMDVEEQAAAGSSKNLKVSLIRSLTIETRGKTNVYKSKKTQRKLRSKEENVLSSLTGADKILRRIKAVDFDSLSRTSNRAVGKTKPERANQRAMSKRPKPKAPTTSKTTLRDVNLIKDVRPKRSGDASIRSENGRKRLTREEEGEITRSISNARQLLVVRDDICKNDASRLPTEEEWAAASDMSVPQLRRILEEGKEAQTILVSDNINLVTGIARKHYYAVKRSNDAINGMGGLSLQDFIQEGTLGLLAAAERFDSSRGFRFSTYAHYWIRQRILKSISDSSRVIRLPESVTSKLRKIAKARREMYHEIGREPSEPELAHYMQIPIKQLRSVSSKAPSVVSLESPIKYNSHKSDQLEGQTIGDMIASDTLLPEEDAQRQYLQNDIRAVINQELGEREREVLVARFGLERGEPLSASHTAQLLGVSVDQVRVIEARALNNYAALKETTGSKDTSISESKRMIKKTSYNHLKDLYSSSDQGPPPAIATPTTTTTTTHPENAKSIAAAQELKQCEKLW
eukprot:CAMPEP_0113481802 /NCGR_PEP_ID=MMETSP0014_2-20120614/22594_1 /TAXON_ID=2857 /ORGANISM="Nitzschia sp." /LENGTH=605 /DNA_ID=CAMNT_0000375305 /DNA_START=1172 /DNA_END=2987 /DNA_ORIENTATION=+ /assembly_acc=CAM_ASM_000159